MRRVRSMCLMLAVATALVATAGCGDDGRPAPKQPAPTIHCRGEDTGYQGDEAGGAAAPVGRPTGRR